MSATVLPSAPARAGPLNRGHLGFTVAWGFYLLLCFGPYALRSAPGVMAPELTGAFGLTTLGVSSLLGLYYYACATFVIGASLDDMRGILSWERSKDGSAYTRANYRRMPERYSAP